MTPNRENQHENLTLTEQVWSGDTAYSIGRPLTDPPDLLDVPDMGYLPNSGLMAGWLEPKPLIINGVDTGLLHRHMQSPEFDAATQALERRISGRLHMMAPFVDVMATGNIFRPGQPETFDMGPQYLVYELDGKLNHIIATGLFAHDKQKHIDDHIIRALRASGRLPDDIWHDLNRAAQTLDRAERGPGDLGAGGTGETGAGDGPGGFPLLRSLDRRRRLLSEGTSERQDDLGSGAPSEIRHADQNSAQGRVDKFFNLVTTGQVAGWGADEDLAWRIYQEENRKGEASNLALLGDSDLGTLPRRDPEYAVGQPADRTNNPAFEASLDAQITRRGAVYTTKGHHPLNPAIWKPAWAQPNPQLRAYMAGHERAIHNLPAMQFGKLVTELGIRARSGLKDRVFAKPANDLLAAYAFVTGGDLNVRLAHVDAPSAGEMRAAAVDIWENDRDAALDLMASVNGGDEPERADQIRALLSAGKEGEARAAFLFDMTGDMAEQEPSPDPQGLHAFQATRSPNYTLESFLNRLNHFSLLCVSS